MYRHVYNILYIYSIYTYVYQSMVHWGLTIPSQFGMQQKMNDLCRCSEYSSFVWSVHSCLLFVCFRRGFCTSSALTMVLARARASIQITRSQRSNKNPTYTKSKEQSEINSQHLNKAICVVWKPLMPFSCFWDLDILCCVASCLGQGQHPGHHCIYYWNISLRSNLGWVCVWDPLGYMWVSLYIYTHFSCCVVPWYIPFIIEIWTSIATRDDFGYGTPCHMLMWVSLSLSIYICINIYIHEFLISLAVLGHCICCWNLQAAASAADLSESMFRWCKLPGGWNSAFQSPGPGV